MEFGVAQEDTVPVGTSVTQWVKENGLENQIDVVADFAGLEQTFSDAQHIGRCFFLCMRSRVTDQRSQSVLVVESSASACLRPSLLCGLIVVEDLQHREWKLAMGPPSVDYCFNVEILRSLDTNKRPSVLPEETEEDFGICHVSSVELVRSGRIVVYGVLSAFAIGSRHQIRHFIEHGLDDPELGNSLSRLGTSSFLPGHASGITPRNGVSWSHGASTVILGEPGTEVQTRRASRRDLPVARGSQITGHRAKGRQHRHISNGHCDQSRVSVFVRSSASLIESKPHHLARSHDRMSRNGHFHQHPCASRCKWLGKAISLGRIVGELSADPSPDERRDKGADYDEVDDLAFVLLDHPAKAEKRYSLSWFSSQACGRLKQKTRRT
nr:hypothetical protein CFP56_31534 [Quercus suber]